MFKILKFKKLDSSNTQAKKIIEAGKPGNFVVVAEEQTAGRGQRERAWYSPQGGLYFSLVLRPKAEIKDLAGWPYLVAKTLKKVIFEIYGIKTKIKKPNDLIIGQKKVAGILIESRVRQKKTAYLIIGIGVNLKIDFKNTPWEKTAVSLAKISKKVIFPEEFFSNFIKQFKSDFGKFI